MVKKLLPVILCLFALKSNANPPYGKNSSCPKFYIGFSTGLENQSGLLGPNFDFPITESFSLGAGAGLSTWGWKTYFEGRFYFGECNRKWALGTGVTYNTGLSGLELEMPTTIGTTDVTLNLEPSPNIFFSGYHFFNMGSRHRFYLQAGYSQRLVDRPYTVTSPHILTSDGETAMQILSPGGIIFALGFSFGIGG